ncbi:hypothetical protein ACSAZK_02785 [Methanosarcina sp. Mfa9]|uniref:hypothetical protein n=1 Tax=Methanosarcina sp. Mfa9 TaxID=3439063 RepID=UPI003F84927B
MLLILLALCLSGCTESPEEGEHTDAGSGAVVEENISEASPSETDVSEDSDVSEVSEGSGTQAYSETEPEAIVEESFRNDYSYAEFEGRFLRQTGFEADPALEGRYTLTYLYDVRTDKLPKSVTGFSVELIIEDGKIVEKTYTKLLEDEYPSLFSQEIDVQQVSVSNGILLEGTSTLPEATVLRSQLFADGEPESWWPKNTTTVIRNGKWKFEVALGEEGRPDKLSTEAEYLLLAWKEDEPAVRSGIYFDLSGPPTPEE